MQEDNGDDEEQMGAYLVRDDEETDRKTEMSPVGKLLWASAMLMSGTCTTLFAKAMFEEKAHGSDKCHFDDDDRDGKTYDCTFDKPWFSVLLMKLAMAMCLPLYYGLGWGKQDPDAPNPDWKTIRGVYLPSALDLLNTILGNVGLLFVNSSIYQMTRGSVVIFSAILSVKWLGRTLRSFHYWAIGLVIVAVAFVGLAGIEASSDGGDSNAGMVIVGLMLIIAAQAVTAVQFITEEEFMNEYKKTKLDPVALVGFEGLWGLVYFVVLAPYLTYTPSSDQPISILWHEDFNDTFVQISNSKAVAWLCVGYFFTILMYNVSANFVTQILSAVVRSILEACRTLGVWLVGLAFFYLGNSKTIGEAWTGWSFLELFGFMVLLAGTFAYKALVKLPCVPEEVYKQAEEDDRQFAAEQEQKARDEELNAEKQYHRLDG